jgi:hypothetical protein
VRGGAAVAAFICPVSRCVFFHSSYGGGVRPSSIGAHRIQDNVTREASRQHFWTQTSRSPVASLSPHLRTARADKIMDWVTILIVRKNRRRALAGGIVFNFLPACGSQTKRRLCFRGTPLFSANATLLLYVCVLIFCPSESFAWVCSFCFAWRSCNLLFSPYSPYVSHALFMRWKSTLCFSRVCRAH